MNKFIKIFLVSCLLMINFIALSQVVLAYGLGDAFKVRDTHVCAPGANDTLDCAAKNSGYDVDAVTGVEHSDTIEPIIAQIISILFSLVGVYFVVITIKAGFDWMTAEGDAAKVKNSIETIKNGVIGIVVVASAYAITAFILERFMTGLVR